MINVDEIFEEARIAFDAGNYPEVIAQLSDDVLQESAHPQLYFFRGMAYYYTENNDKAVEDLTMAITLKPDYFRGILNRGWIWSRLRQHSNAVTDLTQAIKIRPGYASAHRYLGVALNEKGDYDKAILQFNISIELEPDSPDAYLQRGTSYMQMEEYDEAMEDFDRAIVIKPDYASAYTSRGHALYKSGRYQEAFDSFKMGARMNPESGRAQLGLGRVYEQFGKFDLASLHFKRAFYLDYDGSQLIDIFRDTFPAPYIVKAIVEKKQKVEPDFATIQWLVSTCRQWDSYLQHLRNTGASQLKPEIYYRLEAMVNYYMGNSIASYRIFDTKFDSDEYPYPLRMQDHYYLVLSALDFNEPDNGLAYALKEAGGDKGGSAVDSYYAGQLYLLDNDLGNALQCFDRCAQFLPALYGKLSVYVMQGDREKALTVAESVASDRTDSAGYLTGITPLTLDASNSLQEGAGLIQQRIHYYELQAAIAAARELLDIKPLHPPLPFYSSLVFNP